jgi:hypothetical protein
MAPEAEQDRSSVWPSLLRRLTEVCPSWGTWKDVTSALTGSGDVDSVVAADDLPVVEEEFHRWAARHGLGPVIVCAHADRLMHLVVAVDRTGRGFLELDLTRRKTFRGMTLFRPEDLRPLMRMDERGFRRIRAGAEGVILLTHSGLRWGGRPNWEGVRRKGVRELIAEDPDGVRAMAQLFGPGAGAVQRAAAAVREGRWDRRAMLEVEGWALLRALLEPRTGVDRAWLRLVSKRRCPLLHAVYKNRRSIPGRPEEWLASVSRTHEVHYQPTGAPDDLWGGPGASSTDGGRSSR